MNRAERRKNLKAFKAQQFKKNAYKLFDDQGRLIVKVPPNSIWKDGDIFTSDLYPGQEFKAKISYI